MEWRGLRHELAVPALGAAPRIMGGPMQSQASVGYGTPRVVMIVATCSGCGYIRLFDAEKLRGVLV